MHHECQKSRASAKPKVSHARRRGSYGWLVTWQRQATAWSIMVALRKAGVYHILSSTASASRPPPHLSCHLSTRLLSFLTSQRPCLPIARYACAAWQPTLIMSSVIRSVKNVTKGYSSVQVKVRNGMSTRPRSPRCSR